MQKVKSRSPLPKSKMNKRVLGKMTQSIMPSAPKPMLHLSGEHAEQFFSKKPGAKVSAHITGTLQSIGRDEWNGNQSTASVLLRSVVPTSKKSE